MAAPMTTPVRRLDFDPLEARVALSIASVAFPGLLVYLELWVLVDVECTPLTGRA